MWPFPLDDEYREMIKSGIATFRTLARQGRRRHLWAPCSSREFVGDTPWIHLDIAGTAWQDDVKPWAAKARRAWGSHAGRSGRLKFGANGQSTK